MKLRSARMIKASNIPSSKTAARDLEFLKKKYASSTNSPRDQKTAQVVAELKKLKEARDEIVRLSQAAQERNAQPNSTITKRPNTHSLAPSSSSEISSTGKNPGAPHASHSKDARNLRYAEFKIEEDTEMEVGANKIKVFESQLCQFHNSPVKQMASHNQAFCKEKSKINRLADQKRARGITETYKTSNRSISHEASLSDIHFLSRKSFVSRPLSKNHSPIPERKKQEQKKSNETREKPKKKINVIPCFPKPNISKIIPSAKKFSQVSPSRTASAVQSMIHPSKFSRGRICAIPEIEEEPSNIVAFLDDQEIMKADENMIGKMIKESLSHFDGPLKKLYEAAQRKKEANKEFEAAKSEVIHILQLQEEAVRKRKERADPSQPEHSEKSASSVSTNIVPASDSKARTEGKKEPAVNSSETRTRSFSILKQ